MKNLYIPFALSALMMLGGCSVTLPEVGGDFDSDAWKQDTDACTGARAAMLDDILAVKDDLVTLREADVRQLFGRPDNVELFSRSKKFYLYYIEAGGQCPESESDNEGKQLEMSLDALGRLHELNIRQ